MPRITIGFIVIAIIIYLIGANYPGIASKVGLKFT